MINKSETQIYDDIAYIINIGKWVYNDLEKLKYKPLPRSKVTEILSSLNKINCWDIADVKSSYIAGETIEEAARLTSRVMSDEFISENFGSEILDYGCFEINI